MILKKIDHLVFRFPVFPRLFIYLISKIQRKTSLKNETVWIRPGGMGDLVLLTLVAKKMDLLSTDRLWLIQKRAEPWAKWLGLNYKCLESVGLFFLIKNRFSFRSVYNFEQFFGLSSAYSILLTAKLGRFFLYSTNRMSIYLHELKSSEIHFVPYQEQNEHETLAFYKMISFESSNDSLPASFPIITDRLVQSTQRPIVWISGRQSDSRRIPLVLWKSEIEKAIPDLIFDIHFDEIDFDFAADLALVFPRSNLMMNLDFNARIECLKTCSFVLTVDSGVVHMASYLGVPTVAIFTSGDEKKWAPLAKGSTVRVRSDLACHPCNLFGQVPPCPNSYQCWKLP